MVDGKKLKKIVIQILKKRGLSLSHATISANALINAEYVGAYGHGISRLKMYCERIKKKVINPKPKIKIRKISNSISFVDANNSIGFVAADTAIKTLIKNTKKNLARNKINSPKDIVKTNFLMVDFSDSIKNSENEIRFFLKTKMYNNKDVLKKNNEGKSIIKRLFNKIKKRG